MVFTNKKRLKEDERRSEKYMYSLVPNNESLRILFLTICVCIYQLI